MSLKTFRANFFKIRILRGKTREDGRDGTGTTSQLCAHFMHFEQTSHKMCLESCNTFLTLQSNASADHAVQLELKIRGCIQKFPGWPPGAKIANGTALCH
jgi:hypothetical protein